MADNEVRTYEFRLQAEAEDVAVVVLFNKGADEKDLKRLLSEMADRSYLLKTEDPLNHTWDHLLDPLLKKD